MVDWGVDRWANGGNKTEVFKCVNLCIIDHRAFSYLILHGMLGGQSARKKNDGTRAKKEEEGGRK